LALLALVGGVVGLVAGFAAGRRTAAQAAAAVKLGMDAAIAQARELVAQANGERDQLRRERDAAREDAARAEQRASGAESGLARARDQFAGERAEIQRQVETVVSNATAGSLQKAVESLVTLANEQFAQQRAATEVSVGGTVVKLSQELEALRGGIKELEAHRVAGEKNVGEMLRQLVASNTSVREVIADAKTETAKLATALRDNRVRGRWGEITLKRILELAGMVENVDFADQVGNEDGKRPDVSVYLPGGIIVPIDAKTPLEDYQQALAATSADEQRRCLEANAKTLRERVREVAGRGYHKAKGTVGFVILFVPIESVLTAAASVDPDLIHDAIEQGVHIASPITLLVYLSAFAHAWSLHKQVENAHEIANHAAQLVDRLAIFGESFEKVGVALTTTVKRYNEAVGSYEARLVPSARNVALLSGAKNEVRAAPVIEQEARALVRRVEPVTPLVELPGAS
jgi:DNA recombination protein RmuC